MALYECGVVRHNHLQPILVECIEESIPLSAFRGLVRLVVIPRVSESNEKVSAAAATAVGQGNIETPGETRRRREDTHAILRHKPRH